VSLLVSYTCEGDSNIKDNTVQNIN
jgi:hypothetical protein